MDAAAKQETDGAPQGWWAGLPGNEADFPMNDTGTTGDIYEVRSAVTRRRC